MKKVLGIPFFSRPVLQVAPDLLGKFLVRRSGRHEVFSMITETEAYDGERDLACHARNGKTLRNEPLYERAGTIYVYFTYGMHWMLNVVTGEKGYPAAVLIRGLEDVTGPARLTKKFDIDKRLNKKKLGKISGLWIEDRGVVVKKCDIKKTPRIGVHYAGIWAQKSYRFVLSRK
ncbi:MAG TPA: DNA-3-methyladenine glycosylase [Candidatus Paceibacterota bacterium]